MSLRILLLDVLSLCPCFFTQEQHSEETRSVEQFVRLRLL